MKPSYLGAIVANPKSLLNKIRKESRFSRVYAEVLSVQKKRVYTEVLTNEGIIHCKKVVFCFGGLRARLSEKFVDEKVGSNLFKVAKDVGCAVMYQDLVMKHPFYSKGVCIPSDNLYNFDFVDEQINKQGETKVSNIYALGECAYGVHGKGRLGGGSIGEILVMSRVVAQQILK